MTIIIKNMLRKHLVNKFIFARYFDKAEEITSLIVQINELDAYDLFNKKLISNFGYVFKMQLTDFVGINEDKISSIRAKKLAKPYLTKFSVFCEEAERSTLNSYK